MNSSFSHALRVIICTACSGAMHVAVEGGQHRCDVCEHEHDVSPRREMDAKPSSLSDEERVARLREADDALPDVPPEVQALTGDAGVHLRDDAGDEAMALWQQTRVELDEESTADLRTRFFHLTMLLYRHLKSQKDDLRLRGVLESAVEMSDGHRDQQVFRGVMARAAARAGDLPAAAEWLHPCTAHSDDLHADTAYRYTAAILATYNKKFSKVLELLGMRVGETPLAQNLDVICSVLRANAHERGGDVEAAKIELSDCMSRARGGPKEIEGVIRNSGDLVLCRQSFVKARRLYDELNGDAAPAPTGGLNLKMALPFVVLSLFFLGLAVMTDSQSTLSGGQRLDMLFFALAGAFIVPFVVLFVRARRAR